MSYVDEGPSNLGSSGGPTGGIPMDAYLHKVAVTPYYEDPDLVENHFREVLTDWGPESITMASNEFRTSDSRSRGFQSTAQLDLRHSGSRAGGVEAWLPSGTFLGHVGGMTDKDPRGHALGPNMHKAVEHAYARADLIKFYDDSDYSVPSEGVNPEQMVTNVRSMQKHFADRYQNFSTAFDSWHNGGADNGNGRNTGSSVAKYTHDGTIIDITEAEQGNRADATALISADPLISYRHSTPDHRFKVAKYGAVRVKQFMNSNDWNNNRMSTFKDNNLVEINGTMVNRKLAHLIIDLEGSRETRQEIAKGTDYGESRNTHVRSARLSPMDVYKIMMIDMASPVNANTSHYDGKFLVRNNGKLTHDNRSLMEHAEFNHEIAAIMTAATKSARNISEDDVRNSREQVMQSAGVHGLFQEQGNRKGSAKITNSLNRESFNNHHIEDAKTTMNYAGIKPSETNRVMEKLDGESYAKFSRQSITRSGKRDGAVANKTYHNEYEQDRDRLDFGTYDRAERARPEDHVARNFNQMDQEYETVINETDRFIK